MILVVEIRSYLTRRDVGEYRKSILVLDAVGREEYGGGGCLT